ncbi:type I secretion system permease/ATPase [Aurantimonas sp. 22II-16-19i]|uniref:type I secretion system permease/ATPase n=1 Tax=Aurantimonas sp. 22II-16-19i TaxID=1317114 RepID=UPI0009F7B971|nr:type I secretion system permease/ATPase [Aurantimonas sp. 22II-16-19i]ORE86711.1 type I secretion system ABC transporter, PrtD family protein [Aurantimonas sp. 22II-16-19i]
MFAKATGSLIVLFAFTLVVNVLLLVQPIYMLQIYDRVLVSASFDTLVYISIIAVVALALLGAFDALRSMIAGRLGAQLETENGADALVASLKSPRASLGDVQPMRDLATVRSFVAGRALLAYLDLPFMPLFIGMLYLIHSHLFWLTLGGAALLALIAFANQWATSRLGGEASEASMAATLSAQAFVRSSESLFAMGMVGNAVETWGRQHGNSLGAIDRLNARNALFSGISRFLRMGLQIAILGYGGYLVIQGEMTAGMIFAASLISGRALQPIDQVIGGWKGFIDARRAYGRLKKGLEGVRAGRSDKTALPAPRGDVAFDNVVVMPQGSASPDPLLKRISFQVPAGECCVVIGPSGAGKSTLVRALVGAAEIRSGAVRIDGADIRNWDGEALGMHVGYLAQEVEILPGTVAENIARFAQNVEDAAVVRAAQMAEVHDLVQKLPRGYDTVIGPAGMKLSGGQRQRIGLARAFFGSPKLLVLDEPNASLDADGDLALDRALAHAKQEGVTVLLVTQRRQVAERADRVLVMRDGAIEDYGPRDAVFQRQAEKVQAAREAMRQSMQAGAAQAAAGGGMAPAPMMNPMAAGVMTGSANPVPQGRFPTVVTGGRKPPQPAN